MDNDNNNNEENRNVFDTNAIEQRLQEINAQQVEEERRDSDVGRYITINTDALPSNTNPEELVRIHQQTRSEMNYVVGVDPYRMGDNTTSTDYTDHRLYPLTHDEATLIPVPENIPENILNRVADESLVMEIATHNSPRRTRRRLIPRDFDEEDRIFDNNNNNQINPHHCRNCGIKYDKENYNHCPDCGDINEYLFPEFKDTAFNPNH